MRLIKTTLIITSFLPICCDDNPTNTNEPDGQGEPSSRTISKITNLGDDIYQGMYTPDSEKIIYPFYHDDDTTRIYSISSDGGESKLIISVEGLGYNPKISQSGERIVVSHYFNDGSGTFEGVESVIVLCNIDGSNHLEIKRSTGILHAMDFAQDESILLYSWYHKEGIYTTSSIWLLDTNGDGDHEITYGYSPNPICFSSDGTRVLFGTMAGGVNSAVYTMDLDGQNVERITPDTLSLYPICYSPSGDVILCQGPQFDVGERGIGKEIYTIKIDGTDLRQITDSQKYNIPAGYSPDGSKILFSSSPADVVSSHYYRDIYIVNIDGTGLERLTNNNTRDAAVCYSPDGSEILFNSNRDGSYDLYTMRMN
ncbi:TolB family protein [Candidatus Neomarinimicrobiota bacterium]